MVTMRARPIQLGEAEAIAQTVFKSHFRHRKIPDNVIGALVRQSLLEQEFWRFEIRLMPPPFDSDSGLETDLSDLSSVLMVTIYVNRYTGEASVVESSEIVW